jgi:formylmethanofuran dehydrogenase subunit C
MSGGRIIVRGNGGHMVGSAYRGSPVGIRGGEIIVFGSAGNEIGSTMRGGLIAIGGDAGDFAGVGMLAGTIIVLGKLGIRTGAGMKRGTVVSMHDAEMLPTFYYDCVYRPTFLKLYLVHLRRLGMAIDDRWLTGSYRRWSGDAVELNRGECLLLAS